MDPKVSKSLGVSLFHPASAWVWSLLSPEPGYYTLKTPQAIAAHESNFSQTSILPMASECCKERQFKEEMWPFQQRFPDCACSMPSSPRGFLWEEVNRGVERKWREVISGCLFQGCRQSQANCCCELSFIWRYSLRKIRLEGEKGTKSGVRMKWEAKD